MNTVAVSPIHPVLEDRAFNVAAPSAWNNLPINTGTTASAQRFTRKLKIFPFNAIFT